MRNYTIAEFKTMLLKMAEYSWPASCCPELNARLIETANTPKLLNKLHSRARLNAYRYCISEHDATFSIIRNGKL